MPSRCSSVTLSTSRMCRAGRPYVNDREWLANLAPPADRQEPRPAEPLGESRDPLRYRRNVMETRTAERNRLLTLLKTANIKLESIVTDVFGISGRLVLQALIEGTATRRRWRSLAGGVLRKNAREMEYALEGRTEDHDRFLLRLRACNSSGSIRLTPISPCWTPASTRHWKRIKGVPAIAPDPRRQVGSWPSFWWPNWETDRTAFCRADMRLRGREWVPVT